MAYEDDFQYWNDALNTGYGFDWSSLNNTTDTGTGFWSNAGDWLSSLGQGLLSGTNSNGTTANNLLSLLTGSSNPTALSNLLTGAGGTVASILGSQAQVDAANKAIAAQMAQFAQTQQNLQPWLTAGTNALTQMQQPGFATIPDLSLPSTPTLPGFNYNANDYYNNPAYKALFQSGVDAIDASAAANGGFGSGNHMAGLQKLGMSLGAQYQNQDFTQNLQQHQQAVSDLMSKYNLDANSALTLYNAMLGKSDTTWNRMAGMAGTGQTTGTQLGQLGANTAANTVTPTLYGGAASASGTKDTTNNLLSMFGASKIV